MNLYLVRHGEALPKEIDPLCPLSAKGIHDIEKIGHCLAKNIINPDIIFHSGKERAKQTAEIIANKIHHKGRIEKKAGLEPLDDIQIIVDDIEQSDQDLLIVGHLPFMAILTQSLLTRNLKGSPNFLFIDFTPGTIACLKSEHRGDWILQWMLRPELA